MTNSNDTIKDEFFGDISEADILNEMARIKSEGWTEEKLLRLCAVLTCENEALTKTCVVHELSFDELYEKYQISEQSWQTQWAKRGEFFKAKVIELHRLHNAQILEVMRKAKETSNIGIAEAFEVTKPENLNPVLMKMVTAAIEPAVKEAHIAGQKDGGKARALVAANKRHAKETTTLKAEAFAWFDKNFHKYPKAMARCAEAATKIVPLKESTLQKYLREWKKLRNSKNM